MKGRYTRFWALLATVSLGLIAGCMQPDTLTEEQVAALEDRVHARWETIGAGKFEMTWEFSTPAYREVFPRQLYPLRFSYAVESELTGIQVLDYDARAAVASVAVRVMSKPVKFTSSASRAVGAVPVKFTEKWILIDGEWWYSASG